MTHLEVVPECSGETDRSLEDRLLEFLAGGQVLTRTRLHDSLAVKNERLGEVLESLERAGRLSHTARGWQRRLLSKGKDRSVPHPKKGNGTVRMPPVCHFESIILIESLSIIVTTLKHAAGRPPPHFCLLPFTFASSAESVGAFRLGEVAEVVQ